MQKITFIIDRADNLPRVALVEFENVRRAILVICLSDPPFELKPGQRAKVPARDIAEDAELAATFNGLVRAGYLRRHDPRPTFTGKRAVNTKTKCMSGPERQFVRERRGEVALGYQFGSRSQAWRGSLNFVGMLRDGRLPIALPIIRSRL
jgi:hypothetical protein